MRSGAATPLLALGLLGCSPSIADLNGHPSRYYQDTVTVVGEITRTQNLPGETLLEIADAREKRILIRIEGAVDAGPTDWVKVTGLFVPELRVGGQTIYDVVTATAAERTSPPWLRNLD